MLFSFETTQLQPSNISVVKKLLYLHFSIIFMMVVNKRGEQNVLYKAVSLSTFGKVINAVAPICRASLTDEWEWRMDVEGHWKP